MRRDTHIIKIGNRSGACGRQGGREKTEKVVEREREIVSYREGALLEPASSAATNGLATCAKRRKMLEIIGNLC